MWMKEIRDIIYRCDLETQFLDMTQVRKEDAGYHAKVQRKKEAACPKGKPSYDKVMDKLFLDYLRQGREQSVREL